MDEKQFQRYANFVNVVIARASLHSRILKRIADRYPFIYGECVSDEDHALDKELYSKAKAIFLNKD